MCETTNCEGEETGKAGKRRGKRILKTVRHEKGLSSKQNLTYRRGVEESRDEARKGKKEAG